MHSSPVKPAAPTTERLLDCRHSGRRAALFGAAQAREPEVSAVILRDPKDIFFLTGVREGISWLIVMADATVAISRHMMVLEVRDALPDCEVLLATALSTDPVNLESFVAGELARRSCSRVMLDFTKTSASSYLSLAGALSGQGMVLGNGAGLVDDLRSIKDEDEIGVIRRCIAIAELALSELIRGGAATLIGATEREVAQRLERLMIRHGADRQGFPDTGLIVASGPNSASAHHCPGSRRLRSGDTVLIDWGAEIDGYRSDQTRTIFLRECSQFAREAYAVVHDALANAARLLGPGVALGDIDHAARATVTSAGFPEFHYGVGHGVGLCIHEAPWIRAHSRDCFKADMVTTLEPGIYLPGIGGIRIERMYRITGEGAEALDSLPTDLESMIVP